MTDAQAPIRPSTAPSGGFRSSALYRLMLAGAPPKGVRLAVADVWPGDPEAARNMLKGLFAHAGELHLLESAAQAPADASHDWLTWFHGHEWLKDLRALDGGEAPYFAREWVSAWLDANARWSSVAWAPEVAAARVINWIRAWGFLVREDAAGPFEKALRKTLGRDVRHIAKSLPGRERGYARLCALKGLGFAALALKGFERRQTQALARLEDEVQAQVLPDGGHIERNPERLAQVLADLLELRALSAAALGYVPPFVQNAIDRAGPMLRALRHPDGGLALFNGGLEGDPAWLDLVLAQTDPTAKPPQRAPYTGFQHLSAGAAHIIMDCGRPGGPGHHYHAGTLSFELSVGRARVFVNCGARGGEFDPWRTALAATAAHTTLTVNDTSSAAFALDGELRRGPERVTCQRRDTEEGALVEASHDGYVNTFGLVHHRAIYMSPSGDDIRGEDRLTGSGGEHFAIRFHLHPGVKASLLGGGGVLLRFGGRTKETWRLRASTTEVALEESVYLGRAGETRRTEQIVVSGPLSGNGALVKWALSRQEP